MNSIDALYLVKYNPFKYGEYLASFYTNLIGVEQNLLLAPLVIPLLSHPIFNRIIESSTKRSSLHTIFFKNSKELYDLQERIDALKELTSESMQYCLLNQWLKFDLDNLSIFPYQNNNCTNVKAATRLAQLFRNRSVHEIYMILGVKP